MRPERKNLNGIWNAYKKTLISESILQNHIFENIHWNSRHRHRDAFFCGKELLLTTKKWVMNYHRLLCKTPHWTTVKKGIRRQRGVHEVNHFLKALCRKYRSFTSKYDEVRDEKTKKRRGEETKIRSGEKTKLQIAEQKIPRRFGRGIFS